MKSEVTCEVCHGEGKVQSLTRIQKVGQTLVKFGHRYSDWPVNALVLSAPVSLTAAIYWIARFPMWLLNVSPTSDTAASLLAFLLGITTLVGTGVAISYAIHLLDNRRR